MLLHGAVGAVDGAVRCSAHPVHCVRDGGVGQKLPATRQRCNLHALCAGGVHLCQTLRVPACDGPADLASGGTHQSGQAGRAPALIGDGDALLGPLLRPFAQDVESIPRQSLEQPFSSAPRGLLGCGLGSRPQDGGNCLRPSQCNQVQRGVPALDDGLDDRLVAGRRPCPILGHPCIQQGLEGRASGCVVAVFRPSGSVANLDPQRCARTWNSRADQATRQSSLGSGHGLVLELRQISGQGLADPGQGSVCVQRGRVAPGVISAGLADCFGVGPFLLCGIIEVVVPGHGLVLPHLPHIEAGRELPGKGVLPAGILVSLEVLHPAHVGARALNRPLQGGPFAVRPPDRGRVHIKGRIVGSAPGGGHVKKGPAAGQCPPVLPLET